MSFDVIVVGSGFGGGVAAARLSEKGMKVLVLERGPWWGPGGKEQPEKTVRQFPRGVAGLARAVRNVRLAGKRKPRERLLNKAGLYEYHGFENLDVVTSSGVGGGSHIYTNILEQPPADYFDHFPREITAEEMQPYFNRVRSILLPTPLPDRPQKNRAFEKAARGRGEVKYPDLAVAWGRDPKRPERVTNAAGVKQSTCTHCGLCVVGCDQGAKSSIDLTYIPMALRCGAELRALCEVVAIGKENGDYRVRYFDHLRGRQDEARAKRLVLAAGTLNTLRLLFAARDAHRSIAEIPATLGKGFSVNGDMGALLLGTKLAEDSGYGAAFNAFVPRADGGQHRYLIGEVGLPLGALPLALRPVLRSAVLLLGIGRDASSGTVGFESGFLKTSVGRSMDRALFDEMERDMAELAARYQARWTRLNAPAGPGKERLITVHPMGGARLSETSNEGVVDHTGQVFGCPGLYVADGAQYPKAPGIPPSLTIAALAERQAALMA